MKKEDVIRVCSFVLFFFCFFLFFCSFVILFFLGWDQTLWLKRRWWRRCVGQRTTVQSSYSPNGSVFVLTHHQKFLRGMVNEHLKMYKIVLETGWGEEGAKRGRRGGEEGAMRRWGSDEGAKRELRLLLFWLYLYIVLIFQMLSSKDQLHLLITSVKVVSVLKYINKWKKICSHSLYSLPLLSPPSVLPSSPSLFPLPSSLFPLPSSLFPLPTFLLPLHTIS